MTTYIKLALALALFVAGLFGGYTWEHRALIAANAKNTAAIATMQANAAGRVAAANAIAAKATQDAATKVASAAANYEQEKSNADAQSSAAIARAQSGVDRLRVALVIAAHTIHSLPVPGAAANPSGTDSTCSDTLSPDVAGRLVARYAERNDLARRLNLAEDTLAAERGK